MPFNGNVSSWSYTIVGYNPGPSEAQPHGRQEVVGGDYFKAMQIPVLQGRTFTDGDTIDSQRVVVIDQYLANRYFAGRSPLGQEIQRGQGRRGPSQSSASSAPSTASTLHSRSRKSGSTIRSASDRDRAWRWW